MYLLYLYFIVSKLNKCIIFAKVEDRICPLIQDIIVTKHFVYGVSILCYLFWTVHQGCHLLTVHTKVRSDFCRHVLCFAHGLSIKYNQYVSVFKVALIVFFLVDLLECLKQFFSVLLKLRHWLVVLWLLQRMHLLVE